MTKKINYALETNASQNELMAREEINSLLLRAVEKFPIEHLACNLGLFLRSSALVKYLVINELYERIINVPGVIMEFGTWWGQNLVLFENLRAIHEPFNSTRHIVGFDTFEGYQNLSKNDIEGNIFSQGNFFVDDNYKAYLEKLLVLHERANIWGHLNGKHELIKGDVTETAQLYFNDNPHTIVALAYFDMGLYNPTKMALEAIKPHLVPGSVILLDELTWRDAPGEAIAFKEVFKNESYLIEKSKFTPQRSIVTMR